MTPRPSSHTAPSQLARSAVTATAWLWLGVAYSDAATGAWRRVLCCSERLWTPVN
ncbi:hypothetical protein PF005_g442 [Phytophthora fragariae]|uniref:Uncharacterized protein n=2 Tax=Phytophthora TaxID=4783 RepID=A0A6A3TS37_9STRA|nr:hypothetical protein PF009_g483 [Phytophthora fragariae]KAE8980527.1 hypothetical protein PR002_g24095 [Phytophthora rubi]KAE9031205.1 hypothetical protein PF011_g263 [Phytophthora fragariae]KAE9049467.1 hypothetical protein PR001_g3286 [Phytophthora rubi]KAE9101446.1 hypothetical protein PF010_g14448 [Phytophthora fragariae]